MAFELKLPDIGEGVVEGEIVQWLVKVGDAIEVDQPLVEVMTDKATVVIPSPRAGIVTATHGAEGDVARVGSVIVAIDNPTRTLEPMEAPEAPRPASSSAKAAASRAPSAVPPPPASPAPGVATAPARRENARVLAAPATRRLARELGVELSSIDGTGPGGRVTSADVKARAEAASAPAEPSRGFGPGPALAPPSSEPEADGVDEVIPVRGVRRKIWEAMARSAFTAPHFTFVEECDVTELVAYRGKLNALLESSGTKLSFLPFIIKAVCVALEEMPQLNGQVDERNQAFVKRSGKHIGLAVAAEHGLTVPVIRHANRRSLFELASEVDRLARAVREQKITSADLGGSTFTVTSLGKDGGLMATPIINHPEVGILGVHKLQKRPVVLPDDSIGVRSMMNLSISCDHRLIDGHLGSQFLCRVIQLLEKPDWLVLKMG